MLRECVLAGGCAAALGLSCATAFAQDVPGATRWEGFSVSVGGGAAKVDSNLAVAPSNTETLSISAFGQVLDIIATTDGTGASTGSDDWEGFGTLQGAYDFRFGNVIVGALADFDFYPDNPGSSSTDSIGGLFSVNFNGAPVFGPVPFADYASVSSNIELEHVWSVGGRLGYLITNNTLLYALGGYTEVALNGQIDLTYSNIVTGPQALSVKTPDELNGYFIGAGGEVAVAQNLALRFEYRYANYSSESSSGAADFSIPTINLGFASIDYSQAARVNADLDAEIHSVRGALVFKLGNP